MSHFGFESAGIYVDLAGFLAAALVLATFTMKTMLPLRIVAICSNVAFIAYGLLADLHPIVVLHGLLLPLNVFRLWQIRQFVRRAAEAVTGELSVELLLPFMKRRRVAKGEMLIVRGDPADEMFYIMSGRVSLPEFGMEIGPGNLLGEIGLFAPKRQRFNSVRAETDLDLLSITRERVLHLYYQHPKLGFYLVRLITERLIDDMSRMQPRDSGDGAPAAARAENPAAPSSA